MTVSWSWMEQFLKDLCCIVSAVLGGKRTLAMFVVSLVVTLILYVIGSQPFKQYPPPPPFQLKQKLRPPPPLKYGLIILFGN
jgi:hypothetical protein